MSNCLATIAVFGFSSELGGQDQVALAGRLIALAGHSATWMYLRRRGRSTSKRVSADRLPPKGLVELGSVEAIGGASDPNAFSSEWVPYSGVDAENSAAFLVLAKPDDVQEIVRATVLLLSEYGLHGYGFVDVSASHRVPHALGMSTHESSPEDANSESRWFSARLAFKAGRRDIVNSSLRDIYPMNILTAEHVSMDISGMPLRDFISGERLGVLSQVDDRCWLWKVSEAERVRARQALRRANRLIA